MKNIPPGFLTIFSSRLFALLGLVLILTGCSTFDRDYQAALKQPVSAESPVGPWTGRWTSDKMGHTGELRCLVQKDIGDDLYTARFKARFWKCFTYTSTATLTMKPKGEEFYFDGNAQLGWLAGGEYKYEGRVNPKFFFSEYQCKWDNGTFYMERPKQ
jgi:hypothetical protein